MKDLKEFIKTTIHEYLNENILSINNIVFNSFPNEILKTLEDEYGHYYLNNFDWNSKQDEFIDNPKGFREWLNINKKEEFIKNLDKIIGKVRQDLILLIKKRNADKVLKEFEELIIPVLGNSILVEPLSKFMEFALLNLHSIKEIEQAYIETKNIINNDGSLNYKKIIPSTIFIGDVISLPNFERFVSKNPEYKGVFNDWKKMFDKSMELSSTELNAFRDSTPYEKIRNLYNFLIQIRDKNFKQFVNENVNDKTFLGYHSSRNNMKNGYYKSGVLNISDYSDIIRSVYMDIISDYDEYLENDDTEGMNNVFEKNGYGFTFVSDKPIKASSFQSSEYKYGDYLYKVYGDSNEILLDDVNEIGATIVISKKPLYFFQV
jgi:hypothetical protein